MITCRNCGREQQRHAAHGWCTACWTRWNRHGRPANVPAPLVLRGTDLDEIAVQRAVGGHRDIALNPVERRAAIATLHARGLTQAAIADQIGCAEITVRRHVAALRQGA